MKKVKIEFISKGFEEILCSDGAAKACEAQGERIRDRANAGLTSQDTEGFSTGGKIVYAYGSKRWMQFISTTDSITGRAEQENQVLSKAVN